MPSDNWERAREQVRVLKEDAERARRNNSSRRPEVSPTTGIQRVGIDYDALNSAHGEAWKAMSEAYNLIEQAEQRATQMQAASDDRLRSKYSSLRKGI